MTAELELHSSHRAARRSRLFLVAVGTEPVTRREMRSGGVRKDALALAEALKNRSAKLHERVDIIPLAGAGVTRGQIIETLQDVAALAKPQDTLALLFGGRGTLVGGEVYFEPQEVRISTGSREGDLKMQGLAGGELAALLGSSPALQRLLVLDLVDPELTASAANADFALRGAVEQWARAQGVFVAVNVSPLGLAKDSSRLMGALLASLGRGEPAIWADDLNERAAASGTLDVMQWFHFTLERAFPAFASLAVSPGVAHASTQMRGFPLLFVAR